MLRRYGYLMAVKMAKKMDLVNNLRKFFSDTLNRGDFRIYQYNIEH